MLTTVNKVSKIPKHVPKNSIKIDRPKRASSHPMHKVNDGTGSQGSSSWCVRIVPNLFTIILILKSVLKFFGSFPRSLFSPCQCRPPSPRKATDWNRICRKTNSLPSSKVLTNTWKAVGTLLATRYCAAKTKGFMFCLLPGMNRERILIFLWRPNKFP